MNTTEKHYSGLTDEQVLQQREKFGKNVLTPPKREGLWKIFIDSFKDPIIRILLMAILLSFGISVVLYISEGVLEIAETVGIALAILLATGISTWFVWDAGKKFDVLNQVNDQTPVKVMRNNTIIEVPKIDIVVGDIVILEQGDEIPADGTLLEATSLDVNESTLTGEPITHKTINEKLFDKDATYPSNQVMKGTTVADGHGIMEVTMVGDHTEFGKVAEKSTEKNEEETPLNKQLNRLAKLIGAIGFGAAGITFVVLITKALLFEKVYPPTFSEIALMSSVIFALFTFLAKVWISVIFDVFELFGKPKRIPNFLDKGWGVWFLRAIIVLAVLLGIGVLFGVKFWDENAWLNISVIQKIMIAFMSSVTLIVVTVPEGLPMSVTLSLALSMRKMIKINNLVRKMHACETMGAVTVICTDKTGTLTQNRMTVYETNFYGLKNQQLGDNDVSKLIIEGISENTTAFLDTSDKTNIKTLGNPTECALLLWLYNNNVDYLPVREETETLEQLTFSTERKYMATEVDSIAFKGKKILYVKGAPEIVLSFCKSIITETEINSIADYTNEINSQLSKYQAKAMRTLGFAYKVIEDNTPLFEDGKLAVNDLTFLGITAISDPVREDVPDAIESCNRAGIQIKMVTGDTSGTAKEIGRQIGLWNEDDCELQHITGSDFANLTDEEAYERIAFLKIMSRARPTDKQRLVRLLQKRGDIVAVTGDGTNDAPALNHANVGLSMGTGTSVAKEASDITLLDDSFSSIKTAVLWGRSVYRNIQRFILFQLTINVVAMLIVLIGSIFGSELPITVTQMLWINLIMDTFAAGALASLPPTPELMRKKPRDHNAFIITNSMRKSIIGVALAFVVVLLSILYYYEHFAGGINPFTEIGLANLTKFFTIFVMLQFWNLFNAKTYGNNQSIFKTLFKNAGFTVVCFLILIGQFCVVQFGGKIFRTVPLTLNEWLWIIAATSIVLWIGEIYRAIIRSKKSNTI